MDQDETVVLNDNLNDLHKLIEVIEKFREKYQLSQAVCYSIHLVCEEVFVNFVNYSTTLSSSKQMTIDFALHDSLLTITLVDNGAPINPLDIPLPDVYAPLEERSTGGLGIFLVRHWADNLSYCHNDSKNILTIQKKLT